MANAPNPMSIATQSQAPSGNTQIEIHGSYLDGVLVPPGMVLTDLFGVPVEVYESLPEWERIEIVGLPVEPSDWLNVGTHADDQGPVGGLMSPRDAAIDRIVRGTPPFGWETQVAPGVARADRGRHLTRAPSSTRSGSTWSRGFAACWTCRRWIRPRPGRSRSTSRRRRRSTAGR